MKQELSIRQRARLFNHIDSEKQAILLKQTLSQTRAITHDKFSHGLSQLDNVIPLDIIMKFKFDPISGY